MRSTYGRKSSIFCYTQIKRIQFTTKIALDFERVRMRRSKKKIHSDNIFKSSRFLCVVQRVKCFISIYAQILEIFQEKYQINKRFNEVEEKHFLMVAQRL